MSMDMMGPDSRMDITMEICAGCEYSTTKLFGFETSIMRCTFCGCISWAKTKLAPKCPVFRNMDEYEKKNGKRFDD